MVYSLNDWMISAMFLTVKYDNETTHEVWFHDAVIWKRCVPRGEIEWVIRGNTPSASVIPPSKEWAKGLISYILKGTPFEGVEKRGDYCFAVKPLKEGQTEVVFAFKDEEELERFKKEIVQLCNVGWEKPERRDWRKR